jgi:hypothetical protein
MSLKTNPEDSSVKRVVKEKPAITTLQRPWAKKAAN